MYVTDADQHMTAVHQPTASTGDSYSSNASASSYQKHTYASSYTYET